MKIMSRIMLLVCLGVGAVASPLRADVQITNIAVSPRLLMEIYQAWKEGRTNIPMLSSKIFYLALDANENRDDFQFRFEVKDGDTNIASVNFVTTAPVQPGKNVYGAHQITTPSDNVVIYNNDYINTNEVLKMLRGGESRIRGDFKLMLTPVNARGPVYTIPYAMFAPVSAQDHPPRIVNPKGIAVTSLLPVFSWLPGQGATFYEVLVGPNQDPSVNTYWRSEKVTASQAMYPPSGRALQNGQKYYWQVIAYDEFRRPIGGTNGKSEPAWFKVLSAGQVTTAV
ncbi:hypothetical protein JW933_00215, partial [candidate division FCPU426 bacterium]|nr:hypothetical protein [candidate division FCPU426 bacterium]